VQVARRLAAVEAALGSEDLASARTALERLTEAAPDHPQLSPLRYLLDELAERLTRRERLTAIATSVRDLLSRDDTDAAGQALEEALSLDGEDGEARALLDRVETRRAERELARRAALDRQVTQAETRLGAGDLAGAAEAFEALLAEHPDHDPAVRGLTETRRRQTALEEGETAAKRKADLDARVAECRLRFGDGDLVGAIAGLEAVIREDWSHADAERALTEAQERRRALEDEEATAQRQTALATRTAEGRLRLAEGDVIGAIAQFETVLAEEPSHAEAQRALGEAKKRLETLESRIADAERRAGFEAQVAAGRRRLSGGDVAAAITHFQAVLGEDSTHADAKKALAEAQARLEAIGGRVTAANERAALDGRVAAASGRLAAGELAGAIERFEAVLRDSAAHAEAKKGLETARRQQTSRAAEETETARRGTLDARVAEAQARLAGGDVLGAIQRLEGVMKDDPKHAEAKRGLGEARERWSALEARVTEAQRRLAAGDLGDAIARLEAVLQEDATNATARQHLSQALTRRAAQQARETEIATALGALEGTFQAPDVEAVQAAFAWLVDLAPAHPQLGSLRNRIAQHQEQVQEDREQLAREALADAGRLIREGNVERALEAMGRVRAASPDHPDLVKLDRQVQRLAAARDEKVRGLVASARDLLQRDDVNEAQRAVQDALALDSKHEEAVAILEQLRSRGRELAEAGRADELAAEAARLVGEGKVAEGEARMRELGAVAPQHPALAELPGQIEQARRTQDPEVIVQTALEEAARLIREVRPERIPEVLARLRAVQPDHPQLAKLEAQAQKLLEARDARLRVRTLLDRARKLQVRGEFEEALGLAEEAVGLAPDDGAASRLRDDLADQLQDARRQGRPVRSASPAPSAPPSAPAAPARSADRDRVSGLLAAARERMGRDDLPAAKEALEQALGLAPNDQDAKAMLEKLQTRERDLVVGRVRTALDAGDPIAAQAALIRLSAVMPQHPELAALRTRVSEVKEQVVRDAVAEAEKFLREGAVDRLSAALGRLRAVAPDNPNLEKLQSQAQRVIEARDAGSKVRALLDRAQKLAVAGDIKQALAAAEEAVTAAPNDARALRLRDSLAEQLQKGGRGKR
jgi:tetratricopeptide (TPR) repeat protein